MAEPRNGKCAQPFTVLDLVGDQDNFLAFGVAGFCHGCLRFEKGAENSSSFVLSLSTSLTYRLRFSEVGNAGEGFFRSPRCMIRANSRYKVRSVSPPISARLRTRWKEFLSALRGHSLLFQPRRSAISGGFQIVFRELLVQLNEAIWREYAVQ